MYEISAVAENNTYNRLDEESDEDVQKHRCLCELDVCLLVVLVELAECPELAHLLDEGLDHRDTREVLLGEVREGRVRLLAKLPFFHHIAADESADREQKRHRYKSKERQKAIHLPHSDDGKSAEQDRIAEHERAVAEALLNSLKIVGEERHHIADLVALIVLLRETLAVIEHLRAQIGLDSDSRAKEAYTPKESTDDHRKHDQE